jgi:transposase-like protein
VDTKVEVKYTTEVSETWKGLPNAVYTKEFREEAVMMITEGGLTIPEVARRLSIPKSTISYWVRAKSKALFLR